MTFRPSGPVWCVTSCMPRIFLACSTASSGVFGELDAAPLAAAAGVDLRLDDGPAAELLRDLTRLLGRVGDLPARRRDTVAAEDLLRLVLVNFHSERLSRCRNGRRAGD